MIVTSWSSQLTRAEAFEARGTADALYRQNAKKPRRLQTPYTDLLVYAMALEALVLLLDSFRVEHRREGMRLWLGERRVDVHASRTSAVPERWPLTQRRAAYLQSAADCVVFATTTWTLQRTWDPGYRPHEPAIDVTFYGHTTGPALATLTPGSTGFISVPLADLRSMSEILDHAGTTEAAREEGSGRG